MISVSLPARQLIQDCGGISSSELVFPMIIRNLAFEVIYRGLIQVAQGGFCAEGTFTSIDNGAYTLIDQWVV